jgi:hypothetical protein
MHCQSGRENQYNPRGARATSGYVADDRPGAPFYQTECLANRKDDQHRCYSGRFFSEHYDPFSQDTLINLNVRLIDSIFSWVKEIVAMCVLKKHQPSSTIIADLIRIDASHNGGFSANR